MTNIIEPEIHVVSDQAPEIIPRRPYDFNAGDRRFYDRDDAINHAVWVADTTGVRQQVRVSSAAVWDGPPLWLVQAV